MGRARKASRESRSHAAQPAEQRPEMVPGVPRKHPLLLALSIVLLVGWLAFLVAMALR